MYRMETMKKKIDKYRVRELTMLPRNLHDITLGTSTACETQTIDPHGRSNFFRIIISLSRNIISNPYIRIVMYISYVCYIVAVLNLQHGALGEFFSLLGIAKSKSCVLFGHILWIRFK